MPFFILAVLSIILALGGAGAALLGFEDRSPGLLTGGAVAIGSAALLFGLAMLLRELRTSRQALIDALANRVAIAPAPPQPVRVEQPASPVQQPLSAAVPEAATDAALAAFAAGLAEEASRPVDRALAGAMRFPPPPKREEPESDEKAPEKPAIGLADKPVPIHPAAREPLVRPTEPLRPVSPRPILDPLRPAARRSGEARPPFRPPFRLRPVDEPPASAVAAASVADEAAVAIIEKPAEIVADREPLATPKPPDIDTILNEIIARRDRPAPPRDDEPPTLNLTANAVSETAEVVAASEEAIDRSEQPATIEAEKPAAPAQEAVEEAETIEAKAAEDDVEPAPETVEEPAAPAAEEAPAAEAVVEPVAEKVDEPAAVAAEPVAAEEVATPAEPEPEVVRAPTTPPRKMVRSFSSGPNRYTMYDDGSIEAETPTGRLTFASFDELRRYIDERMTQRGTGT